MFALTFALLAFQHSPADCAYDRAAILALDERAFDQNLEGGWRSLAAAGCTPEAADLIRDWRVLHKATATILFWHEGQLRAEAGQADQAIALFEQSRRTMGEDGSQAWNLYVDGSLAFLRRDRAAFDAARAKLSALPQPATFDANPKGPDGKPILLPDGRPLTVAWPPNLNVFDRLSRCWGQGYKVAYACPAGRASE
ncbi:MULTISPECIES: hypothetical protein [unclassified Sphingomonas]|nr:MULTISPECIES: hypothetical protein [unclassified Sphingomonas]